MTHYDVLGVSSTASADEIRVSYRGRARLVHPDRAGSSADDTELMAQVNEAYRVLCDPGRRADYDRLLRLGTAIDTQGHDEDESPFSRDEQVAEPPPPPRHSPISPSGPARLPWKLMLVTAVLGSAVVLVAAAVTDPPSEEPPDGILRSGSCVEIEANGDAREISCTGDGDIVVELLLPTGARCPGGTLAHRDRLGLGTACIAE